MAELRCTRPCHKCRHSDKCAQYLCELSQLVADHSAHARHPLPDVVVDCLLYQAAKTRERPPRSRYG